MDLGAREMAAEAPEALLAAPEMAPEMELERKLEIAPSSQWVLSFQPLVSSAAADPLTW